jgi:hypothetical protein
MSNPDLRTNIKKRGWSIESEKHYACISVTPMLYEQMRSEFMETDPIQVIHKYLKWLSEQSPDKLFLELGDIDYEETCITEFNYEQS